VGDFTNDAAISCFLQHPHNPVWILAKKKNKDVLTYKIEEVDGVQSLSFEAEIFSNRKWIKSEDRVPTLCFVDETGLHDTGVTFLALQSSKLMQWLKGAERAAANETECQDFITPLIRKEADYLTTSGAQKCHQQLDASYGSGHPSSSSDMSSEEEKEEEEEISPNDDDELLQQPLQTLLFPELVEDPEKDFCTSSSDMIHNLPMEALNEFRGLTIGSPIHPKDLDAFPSPKRAAVHGNVPSPKKPRRT